MGTLRGEFVVELRASVKVDKEEIYGWYELTVAVRLPEVTLTLGSILQRLRRCDLHACSYRSASPHSGLLEPPACVFRSSVARRWERRAVRRKMNARYGVLHVISISLVVESWSKFK